MCGGERDQQGWRDRRSADGQVGQKEWAEAGGEVGT